MKKIIMMILLVGKLLAFQTYEALTLNTTSWVELNPKVDGNNYINIQNLSNVDVEISTNTDIINPPKIYYKERVLNIDKKIYLRLKEKNKTVYISIERY